MQTFLPYPSFWESLDCLDYRRLGKQRVEARQILKALTDSNNGWRNHPTVRMWKGYESSLLLYSNLAIEVWMNRGYKNTMEILPIETEIIYPHWLGDESFHASHRSNLLRKNLEFYRRYDWMEPDYLPYIWPV